MTDYREVPEANHNFESTAESCTTPTESFEQFINDPSFPCVGAKSALNRNRMRFHEYTALNDACSVARLSQDLKAFGNEFENPGEDPVTFVAAFSKAVGSEADFEVAMWKHLQAMHALDAATHEWDDSVSSDPNSANFSFSIAGRAYFVVGLHPHSSRAARRAPQPTLVFNFHNQFEALRASGKYTVLQKAIRRRDIALQGDINPVLARFGEASEARQYSGRSHPPLWVCPFRAKVTT